MVSITIYESHLFCLRHILDTRVLVKKKYPVKKYGFIHMNSWINKIRLSRRLKKINIGLLPDFTTEEF